MRPDQFPDPGRLSSSPFTAVICTGNYCGDQRGRAAVDGLRDCVRRHPHAVLISAGCLLGRIGCHASVAGRTAGVLAMIQPCTIDREPVCPALWVGPLASDDDIATVCRWLDDGDLRASRLPARLRFRTAVGGRSVSN